MSGPQPLTAPSYPPTRLTPEVRVTMTDVVMVVLLAGFFVLAALFAAWLDRI